MLLASGGDDIKLWDTNGFVLQSQFSSHDGNLSCVCWSHDNSILISSSTSGDKIVITYPENPSFTYSLADQVRTRNGNRYVRYRQNPVDVL